MCTGWLALGIVFSFTRAAWVSLAAAGVLWVLMLAGVRFKALIVGGLGALLVLTFSWDSLVIQLERNNQDSSDDLPNM